MKKGKPTYPTQAKKTPPTFERCLFIFSSFYIISSLKVTINAEKSHQVTNLHHFPHFLSPFGDNKQNYSRIFVHFSILNLSPYGDIL